ncbi:MAG: hypothetical protein Ta2D_10190 [Rickettsiales bacterium]|nr:MAG: hypothetical protein Ta2D_10190 [Rickettsiales bacterium]
MRIIKATITAGIIKTDRQELIPISDVILVGKSKDPETREGVIICDEDKFVFIDTDIISKLQLPILDIVIQALNQVATSVTNSMCPQAPSGTLPLTTTITADLQPIIIQMNKIKGEI